MKERVKNILERLSRQSSSLFLDNIIAVAGEWGIGELQVLHSIDELKQENFISEPIPGVIKISA